MRNEYSRHCLYLLRTLLLLASSSYSMNHLGSPVGVCFACSVLFLFCSRGHGGLESVTVVMKCRMEGWRDSVGGSWLEWCEWTAVVGWWVLAEQAGQQQRFECGVWSWCGGRSVACIITVERSREKNGSNCPSSMMIPDRCLWARCWIFLPLPMRCGLASSDRRNNEAPCTCTASSHAQDPSLLIVALAFFVSFLFPLITPNTHVIQFPFPLYSSFLYVTTLHTSIGLDNSRMTHSVGWKKRG
ncbi:hypothetical protein IWZ01DRAFT_156008 [Phyllosticta capitalensis]